MHRSRWSCVGKGFFRKLEESNDLSPSPPITCFEKDRIGPGDYWTCLTIQSIGLFYNHIESFVLGSELVEFEKGGLKYQIKYTFTFR
jgi:hypothetical protein